MVTSGDGEPRFASDVQSELVDTGWLIVTESAEARGGPVLLFDGLCGFCDRTVQLVLQLDRSGKIRFAPLQGEFARNVRQHHPHLAGVDSLILVEPGDGHQPPQLHVRSEAVIRVGRLVGGAGHLLTLMRLVPRRIRDRAYDLFARHRKRFFGHLPACRIPSAEVRARFLD
jgi:predicted DCC family thiol-disulfide oxidoreductase YuxK